MKGGGGFGKFFLKKTVFLSFSDETYSTNFGHSYLGPWSRSWQRSLQGRPFKGSSERCKRAERHRKSCIGSGNGAASKFRVGQSLNLSNANIQIVDTLPPFSATSTLARPSPATFAWGTIPPRPAAGSTSAVTSRRPLRWVFERLSILPGLRLREVCNPLLVILRGSSSTIHRRRRNSSLGAASTMS